MKFTLASVFLEPGINFKFNYLVDLFIVNQLHQHLLTELQVEEKQKEYRFDLTIQTTQNTHEVELKGPYISKKQKTIEWTLFLPYEKTTQAADPLAAYLDYFFDAAVELFTRYQVAEPIIRSIQTIVKTEVIGNPTYELEQGLFDWEPKIEDVLKELGIEEGTSQPTPPTLVSPAGNGWHYWEIWQNGEDLLVHWGEVGEEGEFHKTPLSEILDVGQEMARQFAEKIQEGYREVKPMEQTELILQYQYTEADITQALDKRHNLETLLNEWLGWTGNGYCREGDIGSGTINIFCQVQDVDQAVASILHGLEAEGQLEGVRIGYWDKEEEDHYTLYPVKQRNMLFEEVDN